MLNNISADPARISPRDYRRGIIHLASFTLILMVFLAVGSASAWSLFQASQDSLSNLRAAGVAMLETASLSVDGGRLRDINEYGHEYVTEVQNVLKSLQQSNSFEGSVFVVRKDGEDWKILSRDESEFNKIYNISQVAETVQMHATEAAGPAQFGGHSWMNFATPIMDPQGEVTGVLVMNRLVDDWVDSWRERFLLLLLVLGFGLAFLMVSFLQIRGYLLRVLRREQMKTSRLAIVEKEKEELFSVARKVQRGIYPQHIPKVQGTKIVIRNLFQKHLEGDYYDFFQFQNEALGILLCEAKGNESSITLANLLLEKQVSLNVRAGGTPASILLSADRVISPIMEREFLASAVFITLNPLKRMLLYAGSGHPAPLLIPAGDQALKELSMDPKMLGSGGNVAIQDRSIGFEAGDRILIFSDGILKASKRNGQELVPMGLVRLQEIILENRNNTLPQMLDAIIQQARQWAGGEENLADDITLIGIEIEKTNS
ncbi:PP2C family protein-serine/threonine phosphatase [Planctomycetota bacterium]